MFAALVLAAVLLLAGCWTPSTNDGGGFASIQGRVYDSLTSQGIPNASVTVTALQSGQNPLVLTAQTDSRGEYAIPRIPVPSQGAKLAWSVTEGQGAQHDPGSLTVSVTPSTQPFVVDYPMYSTSRLATLSGRLSVSLTTSATPLSLLNARKTALMPRSAASTKTVSAGRPFARVAAATGYSRDATTGKIVVELGRHATEQEARTLAKRYGAKVVESLPHLGFWVFERAKEAGAPVGAMGVHGLRDALAMDPNVRSAEESHIVYALGGPNDRFFQDQWNMPLINMPAAWDYTTGSHGVVVAVIDSGIKAEQEDLAGNLMSGWNAIDGSDNVDDSGELVGSGLARFSHGTHVAGIIGAAGNNWLGVAGVNWHIDILPIKALQSVNGGAPTGTDTYVAKAIDYAVSHGADVINLSLGFENADGSQTETPLVLQEAIDRAINSGVIVVAAAGNAGTLGLAAPASYAPVIAVGAVKADGTRAAYSSYGPGLSVVAPGGSDVSGEPMILSTGWDYVSNTSSYVYAAGTSMATPHVAGLAALLVAEGVRGQEAVRRIIEDTATSVGPAEEYGHGLINAGAALEKALGTRNTGVDLTKVRVFTAYPFQSALYTRSVEPIAPPTREPDGRFSYSLQSYPGNWVVAAWLDSDQDGLIDAGDYYGEFPSLVRADPDAWPPVGGIDIPLSPVGASFGSLSVRKLPAVLPTGR